MKRIKTGFICMLVLLVCCLIPGEMVQAATTSKRLFTFKVNDGSTTQKIQVYEYKEDGGKVYVAAKASQQTLTMTASAKKATFTVSSKTSYFKKNYKSVSYIKKVTLSNSKTLNLKVKTKTGVQRAFKVKLLRPSISAVKVSATTFTPGSSKLKVQLNMKSAVALKSYYKIKNSKGKVVYQKNLGTRKSTNYTTHWDGKPSKGNKAGLSASSYVPAGTYKLTGYVEYKVGTKTKYISKTVSIKVKKASTSTSTNTNTSTPVDTSAFKAKDWNWKVILSGDDTLDYMVEKVCQEFLNNNMSEIQRAKVLYNWCDKNLTHIYTNITVKNSQSEVDKITASAACVSYAKQVDTQIATGKASVDFYDGYFGKNSSTKKGWIKAGMIQKQGNCLVMAAIYQALLRHAGIDAYIMENSLPSGGGGHHFWNAVKIGGTYYYCDVDMTTYSKGVSDSSYTWFLRGTNFFYKENRYKTVAVEAGAKNAMTSKGEYRYREIAKSVSATDCPER